MSMLAGLMPHGMPEEKFDAFGGLQQPIDALPERGRGSEL